VEHEQKRRVAMNEATFRQINEGVRAAESAAGPIAFVCECGRLGCNRLIRLRREEYERVREHPRRFAIVPGHEIPEVEDVIERHERYAVIQKHADTADVVERSDPRRPLDD
jgi:hypothetical protein